MLIMESKIIALLSPEGSSREATLLMRRADGQFAMVRIDARMASAARAAAVYNDPVTAENTSRSTPRF